MVLTELPSRSGFNSVLGACSASQITCLHEAAWCRVEEPLRGLNSISPPGEARVRGGGLAREGTIGCF